MEPSLAHQYIAQPHITPIYIFSATHLCRFLSYSLLKNLLQTSHCGCLSKPSCRPSWQTQNFPSACHKSGHSRKSTPSSALQTHDKLLGLMLHWFLHRQAECKWHEYNYRGVALWQSIIELRLTITGCAGEYKGRMNTYMCMLNMVTLLEWCHISPSGICSQSLGWGDGDPCSGAGHDLFVCSVGGWWTRSRCRVRDSVQLTPVPPNCSAGGGHHVWPWRHRMRVSDALCWSPIGGHPNFSARRKFRQWSDAMMFIEILLLFLFEHSVVVSEGLDVRPFRGQGLLRLWDVRSEMSSLAELGWG